MNDKLRKESIAYFLENNCSTNSPWAIDPTGVAMPASMAEFGAKWYRNHIWHGPTEVPKNKQAVFIVQWNEGNYDITSYTKLTWITIKRWAYLKDITPKD